jgi:dTDP-4-dehydrorhamnose 3,5-epimerase
MIVRETKLKGAFIIEPERLEDERGFLARTFCAKEFKDMGLDHKLAQSTIVYNKIKGTLRGMHYQASPYPEAKLVRCTKGAIYDVIVDLRPRSPTLMMWLGIELTETNRKMLYVPAGFAHGYQTLEDETEVFYQMSEFFHSECARGVRWDDPAFRILWPLAVSVISEKDKSYPLCGPLQ